MLLFDFNSPFLLFTVPGRILPSFNFFPPVLNTFLSAFFCPNFLLLSRCGSRRCWLGLNVEVELGLELAKLVPDDAFVVSTIICGGLLRCMYNKLMTLAATQEEKNHVGVKVLSCIFYGSRPFNNMNVGYIQSVHCAVVPEKTLAI